VVAWRPGAWATGAFAGTVWADTPEVAPGAAWSADSWFLTAWREGAWTAGGAPPVEPPIPAVEPAGGNLTGWGYYPERRPSAPERDEATEERRRQEYADALARYEALQADAKQAKAEYEAMKARQDRGAKQQAKAVAALSSELLAAELRLQNLRHQADLRKADDDLALLLILMA
jgi:hypothetical protein